jgi:hypothetical protein
MVSEQLPDGDNEPPGQYMQLVEVLDPIASEYLPAAQSVHTVLLLAVAYLPATQLVHPDGLATPLAADDLPAEQSKHCKNHNSPSH